MSSSNPGSSAMTLSQRSYREYERMGESLETFQQLRNASFDKIIRQDGQYSNYCCNTLMEIDGRACPVTIAEFGIMNPRRITTIPDPPRDSAVSSTYRSNPRMRHTVNPEMLKDVAATDLSSLHTLWDERGVLDNQSLNTWGATVFSKAEQTVFSAAHPTDLAIRNGYPSQGNVPLP